MASDFEMIRAVTFDGFISEKNDILLNCLFGNYDDVGNYIISEKIKEELLSLPKIKKYGFTNSIFCFSNMPGCGEIAFEIVYAEKSKDDYAYSDLYVLENVSKVNGYLQNTIKTHIASFKDSIRNYLEKSYDYYNIIVYDEDIVKTEKLIDDKFLESSIMAKRQFSTILCREIETELGAIYDKFYNFKISLLQKQPNEYTKNVLSTFDNEQQKIGKFFLKENNSSYVLNQLLDKSFEEIKGNSKYTFFENEFNKKLQPVLDSFVKSSNKLFNSYKEKSLAELSKRDKQKIKEIDSQTTGQSFRLKQIAGEAKKSTNAPQKETVVKESAAAVSDEVSYSNSYAQYLSQNADAVGEKSDATFER